MNARCKIHGYHDSPISGCPDCRKQMLDGVVKKWGEVGCPECEEKNELLKEMAEALEKLSRLGNDPYLGNSIGNLIAQEALKKYHEQVGDTNAK